jgi:hypothetical protein
MAALFGDDLAFTDHLGPKEGDADPSLRKYTAEGKHDAELEPAVSEKEQDPSKKYAEEGKSIAAL